MAALKFLSINIAVKEQTYTSLEYLEKEFIPDMRRLRDECARSPACFRGDFVILAYFRSSKAEFREMTMRVEIGLKMFKEKWKDIEELLQGHSKETGPRKDWMFDRCWLRIFGMCTALDEKTGERFQDWQKIQKYNLVRLIGVRKPEVKSASNAQR
jgi:hypothetical protein